MLISPDTHLAIEEQVNGHPVWCALYTRHQHEKSVAEMLSAKGLEVFLPQYDEMRRWKDRKKILSLPLFPCYVFVRGGPRDRLSILTTPGVHMILCTGDRIAAIPEDQIEAIRKTVDGRYHVEPYPFLKCGERVRVKRGSLEGVVGVLVRKKNQSRLVLSVDMLAQSVGVEIDAADVEPALADSGRQGIDTQRRLFDVKGQDSGRCFGSVPRYERSNPVVEPC